jgi:hypothetical protein
MANRISAQIKFLKERKNKNCITDETNNRKEIVIRCEKSFTVVELGVKKLDLRFSRQLSHLSLLSVSATLLFGLYAEN